MQRTISHEIVRGLPKYNYSATTDPSAANDVNDGYVVGSKLINIVSQAEFVCVDNATGAAVLNEYAVATGGGISEEQAIYISMAYGG